MKCMKLLCFGLVWAFFTACSSSPQECVDQLNALMDEVEQKCEDYSEEDWEAVSEDMEELIQQLESHSENMTSEEKSELMKALGRYYGLIAKQGLKQAAGVAGEALKSLPALIEGFTEAFEEE